MEPKSTITGILLVFILFVVLVYIIAYTTKIIISLIISGFSRPCKIVAGLIILKTQSFDGKELSKQALPSIKVWVIDLVYIFYGTAWHVHLNLSIFFWMEHSTVGMFSFYAYMCHVASTNDLCNTLTSNSISPQKSIVVNLLRGRSV